MIETSHTPHALPTIDIEPLASPAAPPGSPPTPVVTAIHQACLSTGFFVAVGHGIEAEMTDLFHQARAFFGQPQGVKEQTPRRNRYGFVPFRQWAIDQTRDSGNTEFLDLGLADEVPLPALPGFEAAIRAYQKVALRVGARLLSAVAVGLGAEPGFFAARMTDPQCRLRLLHYPRAQPEPDGSLPVPTQSHTDYGAITLLATDGVPGLEVKPIDQPWTPVDAPPGSLVINLGDMLARWSNDTYRSTPHRVVGPVDRDRISIPFFVNPNPETVVECIPTCVTSDHPCRYEPVSAGAFLASRIDSPVEPYVDRGDGPVRRVDRAAGA
jgi:isopenicillin N synthase-like dioxygenase